MLLDSNLIIYSVDPEHEKLRHVSAISVVEVLGFHALAPDHALRFEEFFAASRVLPLDDAVIWRAVQLRRARRMTLGDALIAGTALVHQLPLATHNVRDFRWIAGLTVLDPLERS